MVMDSHEDITSKTCSKKQELSGIELTFSKKFDNQVFLHTQYTDMSTGFISIQSKEKLNFLLTAFSFN